VGRHRADQVTVQPGAVLLLDSSIHEIRRLVIQEGGRVECAGPCELRIAEHVWLGPRAYLRPNEVLPASDMVVFVAYNGNVAFQAARASRVRGSVYAINSRMRLGARGEYEGSFVAISIWVLPGAAFRQPAGLGG